MDEVQNFNLEIFKNWWIKGSYNYHSIQFYTPNYPNTFLSKGILNIVEYNNINHVNLKFNIFLYDKNINIHEEIIFMYDNYTNKINCFIEYLYNSKHNHLNIIKLNSDEMIILYIDNKQNKQDKFNNNKLLRKIIITKKDYGYFVEEKTKYNDSWLSKSFSKYIKNN